VEGAGTPFELEYHMNTRLMPPGVRIRTADQRQVCAVYGHSGLAI